MSNKLKMGFIGLGFVGPQHADAVALNWDIATAFAVADDDPVKQEMAKSMGLKTYSKAEEMIADPEIDAVHIAARRHDFRGLGVIEFEYVLDELLFFFLDFPFFFNGLNKCHQLLFGNTGCFFNSPRYTGNEVEKLDDRKKENYWGRDPADASGASLSKESIFVTEA